MDSEKASVYKCFYIAGDCPNKRGTVERIDGIWKWRNPDFGNRALPGMLVDLSEYEIMTLAR